MPEPVKIASETMGPADGTPVVWAHGWGQDRAAFRPLAGSLERLAAHILVDMPGFGESPAPPPLPSPQRGEGERVGGNVWGTENYADAIADFIKANTNGPVVYVGHSFGCRVGIQLAIRHPELVKGLFLIAAAGLPKKWPLHKKIYYKGRVRLFKFLKKLIPFGLPEDWLMKKFGSPDYRNAGPLRTIFVRVVNEDLTATAQKVKCPVTLIYGANDTETPPELGQRFQKLIPQSELFILENLDHYTVLSSGRHQVAPILKKFIESNA